MGDSLYIGAVGFADVDDISEGYAKPMSITTSIAGSKIIQFMDNDVQIGNTFNCGVRVEKTEYETLKGYCQAASVQTVVLTQGTDDSTTLQLVSHTGIVTEVQGKLLHPTDWVDVILTVEILT